VDTRTGDVAWRVTLGSYDDLEAQGFKNTGAVNLGGSIATAGGLLFIAATNDRKFRAFDSRTGRELWMARLDASGNATPITYRGSGGKQYVVIVAGGPGHLPGNGPTSDSVIAYALALKSITRVLPLASARGRCRRAGHAAGGRR
jgi:glucose dehydrogenase